MDDVLWTAEDGSFDMDYTFKPMEVSMMKQLQEFMQEQGLTITVEELVMDDTARYNVKHLIHEHIEEIIDEWWEWKIDHILEELLPNLNKYYLAKQQIDSLELPAIRYEDLDPTPDPIEVPDDELVPRPMSVEEFNADYGRWVGHTAAGAEPKDIRVDAYTYICEFMEMAWTPSKAEVVAFLSQFYSPETVEGYLTDIAFE
jgi:hypothetical protein